MITDQPVNNDDDMRKVTDNILRDAGMTIEDGGGEVTFAGKEPVRKTVIKAGSIEFNFPPRSVTLPSHSDCVAINPVMFVPW